jgi:hypothetical protein
MRKLVLIAALVMAVAGFTSAARADDIQFHSKLKGDIQFVQDPSGTGQDITFANLQVNEVDDPTSRTKKQDSAVGTNVVITAPTHPEKQNNKTVNVKGFWFNSVSADGKTGFFASGAQTGTIKIGDAASSGLLTGQITFIQIKMAGSGQFGISLNLSGMNFSACTGLNCKSSDMLQEFGKKGNGNITFTFNADGSIQQLFAMNGTNKNPNTTAVGGMLTPVPEPASLALLGSGFLVAGRKLLRRGKKS